MCSPRSSLGFRSRLQEKAHPFDVAIPATPKFVLLIDEGITNDFHSLIGATKLERDLKREVVAHPQP
jgi:hypothetical protein